MSWDVGACHYSPTLTLGAHNHQVTRSDVPYEFDMRDTLLERNSAGQDGGAFWSKINRKARPCP